MDKYESNSHKSKSNDIPTKKKVSKVVTEEVSVNKKPVKSFLRSLFIPDDVDDVKDRIISEVIIPSIIKIITDSVDTFFYGSVRDDGSRSKSSRVSYRKFYDKPVGSRGSGHVSHKKPSVDVRRMGFDYRDISFPNRGSAEEVLYRMDELVDAYGFVSVADLFDLTGISSQYTDSNYGWYDVRSGEVIRRIDGSYSLKLPRTRPLN